MYGDNIRGTVGADRTKWRSIIKAGIKKSEIKREHICAEKR